jgi:hypothetical protein
MELEAMKGESQAGIPLTGLLVRYSCRHSMFACNRVYGKETAQDCSIPHMQLVERC